MLDPRPNLTAGGLVKTQTWDDLMLKKTEKRRKKTKVSPTYPKKNSATTKSSKLSIPRRRLKTFLLMQ